MNRGKKKSLLRSKTFQQNSKMRKIMENLKEFQMVTSSLLVLTD